MTPSPSQLAAAAPYPMSPLELASGVLTGIDPTIPAAVAGGTTDLAIGLRSVIEQAIAGRQSYVTFSGGRDSSVVLGIATEVARRTGAPDPVPLTLRVMGSAAADETGWQDLVVKHLRLRDWIRVEITDDLDVFGPAATRVLMRHGLLYPANAYFDEVIAGHAAGGVLLGGAGGDELLEGSYAHHHVRARLGRERMTIRTAAAIAVSVAAKPAFDLLMARQVPRLPWLRPRAQLAFARRLVAPDLAPVRGWAADLASLPQTRSTVGAQCADRVVGVAHNTAIVAPFFDRIVIGAAMAQGGRTGLGGRGAAMRGLADGLLPDLVTRRHTKASFQDAMWTNAGRARLRSGDLLEVIAADPNLRPYLDLGELRSAWQTRYPHFMTTLLAQAAHVALLSS